MNRVKITKNKTKVVKKNSFYKSVLSSFNLKRNDQIYPEKKWLLFRVEYRFVVGKTEKKTASLSTAMDEEIFSINVSSIEVHTFFLKLNLN